MVANNPRIESVPDSFLNVILICYCRSCKDEITFRTGKRTQAYR